METGRQLQVADPFFFGHGKFGGLEDLKKPAIESPRHAHAKKS
jgi:hypothetical protein